MKRRESADGVREDEEDEDGLEGAPSESFLEVLSLSGPSTVGRRLKEALLY